VTFAAGPIQQTTSAWQLLYRTNDQQNLPEVTVTTVLKPTVQASQRPLVAYQTAEDSAGPQCAPSFAFLPGAPPTNGVQQVEALLIDAQLAKGYVVSVADYEGPHGAFGGTKQAGHAVLDGIRAAESFAPLGLRGVGTPVGVVGYSGGAVASTGAAEAQPSYAPELNIKGVAEGGLLGTDFQGVIRNLNGTIFSGLGLQAIAGLSEAYPQVTATLIDQYATPEGKAVLAKAKTICLAQSVATYPFRNIDSYLTIPLNQALQLPDVKAADDLPGSGTPTAPLYIYQGVFDELLPIDGVDDLVNNHYCPNGATVEYHRDLLAEHGIALATGVAASYAWLDQRLQGKAPLAGCHTTTSLTNLLNPGTLQAFGSPLIAANILGLFSRSTGLGIFPF
jgi:hypothetical protein